MKNFILLHHGFETPTQEIMEAWGKWFESIESVTVENLGFGAGREVTHNGSKDLPLGLDSLTGYTIISVESMDEAEKIARNCPMITSIRVYEVRAHQKPS
jgi:hypothetical protein